MADSPLGPTVTGRVGNPTEGWDRWHNGIAQPDSTLTYAA